MKLQDKFPTTTRAPQIGDIWVAKFPFSEDGNMEKMRPVRIADVNDDLITVQMITTNAHKGRKICSDKFKRDSYLTNNYATVSRDKLYRKIKNIKMEG